MTYAKIIADSISPAGHRLTTMEVRYHRFVHAEVLTHRAFSRNSASSRAIPFRKMVDAVVNDPAIPVSWPSEQPGMQGGEEILRPDVAKQAWLRGRDHAVEQATRMHDLGVHKEVCNRLLEPYAWMTVIITATDWDGFWSQRCSPLAQPEIRVAAEAMRQAYEASTPRRLDYGDWHLPYVGRKDWADLSITDERYRKISAARCARVSYLTHDGRRDIDADLALYDRLVSARPMHASPLEHVARAEFAVLGNFQGWAQLRHIVEAGR